MNDPTLELFPHQYEFVTDLDHRYIALRAGLGAGKSFAFCAKALHLAAANCNVIGDHVGIICEPTYPLITDVLIPTMEEVMEYCNIEDYDIKKTGGTPEIRVKFAMGTCTMKMRSAENFRRLIGINAAWAGIDEMDTIDSKIQEAMWVRINARVRRKGAIRQTFVTSTPEGYRFMNTFFVEKPQKDKELAKKIRVIQASTLDNPELDEETINDYRANMTDEQVQAWIYGNVINMTTGRIYKKFDRNACKSTITIDTLRKEHEEKQKQTHRQLTLPELHIGMDFNLNKTAAIVHVIDDKGNGHAIDEMVNFLDTEKVVDEIKARYPEFKINIYPDSSGKNRSHANATADTDILLLKKAGFNVHYKPTNPPVRDRINTMNVAFQSAKYFVNPQTCPTYTQCLERQTYDEKTGEPDKENDLDHPNDAGGYFVYWKFPIRIAKPGGLRMVGMY